DRNALFTPVEESKAHAVLAPPWLVVTHLLPTPRPFDLDDLRARFREQQRCQRAWQQCREIHDAHPLKWSHQLPPPLVHGSLWETHRRLERVQESASGNDASRDQSGWLLPRDAGLAAAEHVFLHLAGGGLWQLLDEAHPLRRLEVGE